MLQRQSPALVEESFKAFGWRLNRAFHAPDADLHPSAELLARLIDEHGAQPIADLLHRAPRQPLLLDIPPDAELSQEHTLRATLLEVVDLLAGFASATKLPFLPPKTAPRSKTSTAKA